MAGGRERAAELLITVQPARPRALLARNKCTSHRQITVARRRKSRACSQRDPAARKLAVSPRGRLASRSKLRPPALLCELRAQAPRETQCSETASRNNRHRAHLQREQTSWPSVPLGSDSRAAVTVAQGTCLSHQLKTCLCMPYRNLPRVPPAPKCCPAALPWTL